MIDGHCHLDKRIGNCAEAMQALYTAAIAAGVKGIVLLNLPAYAFDNKLVLESAKNYAQFFRVFVSIKPGSAGAFGKLEQLKALGARGLKLHPRLHGYLIDSDECIRLVQRAGKLGLPVMVDCFPDARNLALGNTPEAFVCLSEKAPDTRIAIGHAGGHRILDALMVAKYFKNIYLDLSYTLLYYRNSSVTEDIAYAIESIRAERVFWGSDYPDRPYDETVNLSKKEFDKMNLPEGAQALIWEHNVKLFWGDALES